VYAGTVYSGLLYLNRVDRDKNGIIPTQERKTLMEEISSKLMKIKDPLNGKSLFSNVYFAEDIYTGPEVNNAPDLILDAYAGGWNLRIRKDYFPAPPKSITDDYFVVDASQRDFGWHSRDGIFVFSGVDFDKGQATFDAKLPDIPATLMHLYDVPLPDDYDGSVMTEAMHSTYRTRPIQYQPSDKAEQEAQHYSHDEAEALVKHLKALGYLD
jgi:predicted AlkP superfamily phosphohydrolase/phosphomutase